MVERLCFAFTLAKVRLDHSLHLQVGKYVLIYNPGQKKIELLLVPSQGKTHNMIKLRKSSCCHMCR